MPKGQTEAANALGLHYVSRMKDVVLPQAFKISLPATIGFLVQLIKGTSLAAIVGFVELSRAGQIVSNQTFRPLTVFAIVGIMYFLICWPLSLWGASVESGCKPLPANTHQHVIKLCKEEQKMKSNGKFSRRTSLALAAATVALPFIAPVDAFAGTVDEAKAKGKVVIGIQGDNSPGASSIRAAFRTASMPISARRLPNISASRWNSYRLPWQTAFRPF